jgi:uncharacterized membrane protein YkoI
MSALVAVLALQFAMPLHAGHKSKHANQPMLGLREAPPRAAGGISIDQAIQIAERQYGARVVRADVTDINGRRVYVLRLLSEKGVVRTVRIDAETGGAR